MILAIMLATFLSPSFAWQAHATHEEIGHASAAHADARDHDADLHDHHDDAHSAIGHLLAHLPGFLASVIVLPTLPPPSSEFVEVSVQWPRVTLEPPLRPPRLS